MLFQCSAAAISASDLIDTSSMPADETQARTADPLNGRGGLSEADDCLTLLHTIKI
jgi:hypothetical protein